MSNKPLIHALHAIQNSVMKMLTRMGLRKTVEANKAVEVKKSAESGCWTDLASLHGDMRAHRNLHLVTLIDYLFYPDMRSAYGYAVSPSDYARLRESGLMEARHLEEGAILPVMKSRIMKFADYHFECREITEETRNEPSEGGQTEWLYPVELLVNGRLVLRTERQFVVASSGWAGGAWLVNPPLFHESGQWETFLRDLPIWADDAPAP